MERIKKQFVNQQSIQYKMEPLLIEGKFQKEVFTITYTKFIDIVNSMMRIEAPIHDALDLINMEPKNIDHINLMGGGSRIPLLKTKIKTVFNENCLIRQDEDVELTVAKGCGIFAYQYFNNTFIDIFVVQNILSISLGIKARDYWNRLKFCKILKRGNIKYINYKNK